MKVQSCIDYFLQCNKVKLPYICLDSVVRKFNKNKSLLINIVCFLIREKRIESWSKYIFFQLSFMYKVSHVEISKGIWLVVEYLQIWVEHDSHIDMTEDGLVEECVSKNSNILRPLFTLSLIVFP